MPKKEELIDELCRKPTPKNYTTQKLDLLMKRCSCEKRPGGRGSAISYIHGPTGRILIFDGPHPGNELYNYQIKKVIGFLKELGEID